MRKLLAIVVLVGCSGVVRAQSLVYSNINFAAGPFQGQSMGLAATIGTNTISRARADDITPVAGGNWVSQFTFSMANFNAVTVSARPLVRFYAGNGALGGPGTYLAGFNFNPVSLAASNFTLLTATLLPGQFMMPTSTFWAAIQFDNNNGATGATIAQVAAMGQMIRPTPTVGTSADVYGRFDPAQDFAGVNNPATSFFNFGGAPLANFAWEFVVVPEPSSCLLAACGAFGALAAIRRFRRNKIAA